MFRGFIIETAILNPIVKGSRYKGLSDDIEYILFPYHYQNGRYVAYDEQELASNFPLAYAYLLINKSELLKRDIDKKPNGLNLVVAKVYKLLIKKKLW